jgi:hypothetical protein
VAGLAGGQPLEVHEPVVAEQRSDQVIHAPQATERVFFGRGARRLGNVVRAPIRGRRPMLKEHLEWT